MTAPFAATTVHLPHLSRLGIAWVFTVNYSDDDHNRSGTTQWFAATLVLTLWDYINRHTSQLDSSEYVTDRNSEPITSGFPGITFASSMAVTAHPV